MTSIAALRTANWRSPHWSAFVSAGLRDVLVEKKTDSHFSADRDVADRAALSNGLAFPFTFADNVDTVTVSFERLTPMART